MQERFTKKDAGKLKSVQEEKRERENLSEDPCSLFMEPISRLFVSSVINSKLFLGPQYAFVSLPALRAFARRTNGAAFGSGKGIRP